MIDRRNQGTLEVYFLLLSLQLQKGTCIVLSINCRSLLDQNRILVLNNKDPDDTLGVYRRTSNKENYTRQSIYSALYNIRMLLTLQLLLPIILTSLNIKGLPRSLVRLLSYYLKYKNNSIDSISEDYYQTQIILLKGLYIPNTTYNTSRFIGYFIYIPKLLQSISLL